MEIRIVDEELGEALITPQVKIQKDAEYIIKGLCVLQIMCINSKEDPEKFQKLKKILQAAISEIEELYEGSDDSEYSALEQF